MAAQKSRFVELSEYAASPQSCRLLVLISLPLPAFDRMLRETENRVQLQRAISEKDQKLHMEIKHLQVR